MPDLIDQLEALPALGAGSPGPGEIRARARRRSRRRRLVIGSTVAVVLVVAAALAAPWPDNDDAQRVTSHGTEVTGTTGTDTAPPSTSITATPSASTTPATLPPGLAPSGLTAVPVLDLDDGETITVTFSKPSEAELATFLAVCDGEVINRAYQTDTDTAGLLTWCGPAITDVTNPARIAVQRVISTPNGTVDCAANIGRCVVAALLSTGDVSWSPLGFKAESQEPLTIQVKPKKVDDGTTVKVTGEGGLPGQTIQLTVCRAAPDFDDSTECDAIRGVEVPVGDDGRYEADMILYRDLLHYSPDNSAASRWVPCKQCVLKARRSNGQGEPVTQPVEITANGPAIHPTVKIVEAGPYKPGQPVTLRGTGFQPASTRISLQICPADIMTRAFQADCAGVGGVGAAGVTIPGITPTGTFTLAGFKLPAADETTTNGLRCDTNGACAIGDTPGEGIGYLMSGPLDLSG